MNDTLFELAKIVEKLVVILGDCLVREADMITQVTELTAEVARLRIAGANLQNVDLLTEVDALRAQNNELRTGLVA